MKNFVEENCTFTHDGKSFTFSGSYLIDDHGLVYITEKQGKITATDWHGNLISDKVELVSESRRVGPYIGEYKIKYYNVYIDGKKYFGRHNSTWGEALKIRKSKAKRGEKTA